MPKTRSWENNKWRNNKQKIQSVEPNIRDLASGWLKKYNLDYKLEQESLNSEIDRALNEYYSKNGGSGGNLRGGYYKGLNLWYNGI